MRQANSGGHAVHAKINYFDPAVPRGRYCLEDPARNIMVFEPHDVAIRDIRAEPDAVSLARQGFTLASHVSRVAHTQEIVDANLGVHMADPPINKTYQDELLPLIRQLSGALDVIAQANGLLVRFSRRSQRQTWAPALEFPHMDWTRRSIGQFIESSVAAAGRPIAPWRRVVLYQTWRALSDPPQDNLLAVCDRSSVSTSDVVFYDAIITEKGRDVGLVECACCRFGANHRWWYASNMGPNDVLVFIGYDSDTPEAVQTFHTGFDVPGQENAAPRRSLEARFFAFYD
jgi:hypothetical protein